MINITLVYIILMVFAFVASYFLCADFMDYFHCPNWLRYTLILPVMGISLYIAVATRRQFVRDFMGGEDDD